MFDTTAIYNDLLYFFWNYPLCIVMIHRACWSVSFRQSIVNYCYSQRLAALCLKPSVMHWCDSQRLAILQLKLSVVYCYDSATSHAKFETTPMSSVYCCASQRLSKLNLNVSFVYCCDLQRLAVLSLKLSIVCHHISSRSYLLSCLWDCRMCVTAILSDLLNYVWNHIL